MYQFFEDYLERLAELHADFHKAIEGLSVEALDWIPAENMNSLCVLVVHSMGAERYWVGDVAMGEPSNRSRDAEFQARGYTVDQLKLLLDDTEHYVKSSLARLTLSDLERICIAPGRTRQFTAGWSILHALEHTSLHLGHAQITRQLWDKG